MAEDKRHDKQKAQDVQEDMAQLADKAAAHLFRKIHTEQYEALTQAGENTEDLFYSTVEQLAQEAQEAQERSVKITIDGQDVPTPKDIFINMDGYDPKLSPGSPEFDMEAYRVAINAAGGPEAIIKKMDELQERLFGRLLDLAKQAAENILNDDKFTAYHFAFAKLTAAIEAPAIIELYGAEIRGLLPFLAIERQAAKDEEIRNSSLLDILKNGLNKNTSAKKNKFGQLIKAARQRMEDEAASGDSIEQTAEEIDQIAEDLPRVRYNQTELKTITDKLTNVFYSLAAPVGKDTMDGQRQIAAIREDPDTTQLKYERKKSKKEITLFYDFVYNSEIMEKYGLKKRFDDYDFFVMTSIDNLKEAGNDVVSLSRIYKEMTGDAQKEGITGAQLEPIYKSLIKGMSTIITIDHSDVLAAWGKSDGKYHELISPVIPVQLDTEKFIANGKIADGSVRITAQSPFLQVAKPIGHVTAWEKQILRLYTGRKTSRYYSVLRYLMLQIGWMRKGTRNHKILYSSIYEYTGETTTRGRQLTRDMMYRLLDEVFIPAEYITSYKEEAEPVPGVKLTLHKKRLQIT